MGDDCALLQRVHRLTHREAPRLIDLRADVPVELSEFVGGLLARDSQIRPSHAEHVAERLAKWSDQQAVKELSASLPENQQPDDQSEAARSLAQLIDADRCPRGSISQRDFRKRPAPAVGSWRFVIGVLSAVAAIGAAVWLGIILLIPTGEGTLKIESEVADVHLELIDERQQVERLQIERGQNETELTAGTYRVRFAGGHGRLEISPGTIELSRGEQLVARITRMKGTPAAVAAKVEEGDPVGETEAAAPGTSPDLAEAQQEWKQSLQEQTTPTGLLKSARDLVNNRSGMSPIDAVNLSLETGGDIIGKLWRDDITDCFYDVLLRQFSPPPSENRSRTPKGTSSRHSTMYCEVDPITCP